MTNTIPNVPRDFLESASSSADHVEDVRAMVADPSPAGVDGLDVVQAVAWLNTATKEASTHPVVVMDWDDEKEPVESLMPISQHEAIIDGLRGEVGAQRVKTCTALKERNDAREERDHLASVLREWRAMFDGGLAVGPLEDLRTKTDAALIGLKR
jgi:hypothetical protein